MKGNYLGATIAEKWDNQFSIESVCGLKFECYEGSELFEYLYKNLEFQSFIDSINNRIFNEEELKLTESLKKLKKFNNKLKKDIQLSKPKITIKIELEKYK